MLPQTSHSHCEGNLPCSSTATPTSVIFKLFVIVSSESQDLGYTSLLRVIEIQLEMFEIPC